MSNTGKQLSNPFSTGGGGSHFEDNVQASFVALMLTGGFAPSLQCWPIKKIKLQVKYAGYDLDDLVVFVENASNGQQQKLLGQIRHSIKITKRDKSFGEVIHAAWNDFNNIGVFTKGKDVIALITGPLTATDTNYVRPLLEQARSSEDATDFFTKIKLSKYLSVKVWNKLEVFRAHLKKANGDTDVPGEVLFQFLKHFHLLGYDLDIKTGVTLSLFHSLIGQYQQKRAKDIWARLIVEVHSANQNAGTITMDSLPDDLKDEFKRKVVGTIPSDLVKDGAAKEAVDWSQDEFSSELAIANLLGSWSENV